MKIRSSVFENEGYIPSRYTCDGENINPALLFFDVPIDTKGLALVMDDPDSPTGTWVHWTVWNINPKNTKILENTAPKESTQGITSFGDIGYGGPCPGSGEHRYFFKLYALNTLLDLKKGSGKEELLNAMEGYIISEAQLMGKYEREK